MTKYINFLMTLMLAFVLTACGGGGGGGGTGTGGGGGNPTNPTNPTTGGDGNATYYGYSRASNGTLTAVEDRATEPTDLDKNIVVASKFVLEVGDGNQSAGSTDGNNKVVKALVHSPVCRVGADYKDYSAVALSGTGATSVSLRVQENTVTVVTHSYNVGTNTRLEKEYTLHNSSCTDGKVTLGSSAGTVFENGTMVVADIGGTLYLGGVYSAPTMGTFRAYNQRDFSGCNLSGCSGPGDATKGSTITAVASQVYDLTVTATYFSTGTYTVQNSSGYESPLTSSTFDGLTRHALIKGSGANLHSVVVNTGAEEVVVSAIPESCTGTTPTLCTGVSAVMIGVED